MNMSERDLFPFKCEVSSIMRRRGDLSGQCGIQLSFLDLIETANGHLPNLTVI
jgi:hypothetical protein